METTGEEGWGLVMPFLDDSETYTLGFEAGKIWGLCEGKDFPRHMMVHTKNIPQIELVAKHFKCDLFIDESMGPEWRTVTFVTQLPIRLVK